MPRRAHSTPARRRPPAGSRSSSRAPPPRPRAYDTWSPISAPAAATTITAGRYGAPEAANTPAVMTAVSLGTTGKNPSTTAIAKIAR